MTRTADFYLTTAGEYEPLTAPRACFAIGRLSDAERDDYMLVEIEPPFIERKSGVQAARLVLSAWPRTGSLFSPVEWPMPVVVMLDLEESLAASQTFDAEQVRAIARGTVHPTLAEAAEVARRFQNE